MEGSRVAKLQIIGGGKMGEALLTGLVATGWAAPTELVVVEPDDARRDELAAGHGGVLASTGPVADTDAVLAVKPGVVAAALDQLVGVGPPWLIPTRGHRQGRRREERNCDQPERSHDPATARKSHPLHPPPPVRCCRR